MDDGSLGGGLGEGTGGGLALSRLSEDDAARGLDLSLGNLHEHAVAEGSNLRKARGWGFAG